MHTKHARYDTPGSPWYQLKYMHVHSFIRAYDHMNFYSNSLKNINYFLDFHSNDYY